MIFTVIGGKGFIGRVVAERLRLDGYEVFVPDRDDSRLMKKELGNLIYAAGVTADFRYRQFDTIRAHVSTLLEILERAKFDSLLYLSSARLYRNALKTKEDSPIVMDSEDPENFYDITKLAGEALCHSSGRQNVRVVRLANVIGRDFHSANFLFDIIQSACSFGRVELRSALESEKDYVMVDDVVDLLPKIAMHGRHRCYNIASGVNIPHSEIVNSIASKIGFVGTVVHDAPKIIYPTIDIRRIQSEFNFVPKNVLFEIPTLVSEYRKIIDDKDRS